MQIENLAMISPDNVISAIIGALIAHFLDRKANRDQVQNEKKIIAKAIEYEIKEIGKSPSYSFFTAYITYTREPIFLIRNPVYPDQKTFVHPNKYYNKETGLYFAYLHDINKLDSNLASKIHTFYNNLIDAENLRLFLSQKPNFKPYEDPEGVFKYREMTNLIIKCGDSIPKLIEELEKVQN